MIRLVHLADVHFGGGESKLHERIDSIARVACMKMPEDCESIVLLFNGDLANSGGSKEFAQAACFIEPLVKKVSDLAMDRFVVHTLVTSGNHDCEFSGDQELRDLGLSTLAPERPAPSVEKAAISPLNNFFHFINNLNIVVSSAITEEHPYFREYRIDLSDASVQFYLLNSAWMSKRKEKANEATFPLELLPKADSSSATTSIVAMHHPLNWFRMPDTRSQLRNWIEKSADLLITGHEHTPRESSTSSEQIVISHCEGGALQEWDGGESSCFQVLDIDIGGKKASVVRYEYTENQKSYKATSAQTLPMDNPGNEAQPRRHRPAFRDWLEDPMLPIQIANKGQLRLQDFFLYPDLNDYSNSIAPEDRKLVPGSRVFEKLLESERVLLTGDDTCGKTAMARQLVAEMHGKGKIPVYLEAKAFEKTRSKRTVEDVVSKAIKRQYVDLTYESILQRFPNELTIIVDDFHTLYTSGTRPTKTIEFLDEIASHVVIFASEELVLCESQGASGDFGGYANYAKFQIKEFGQLRLEMLAKKWVLLSSAGKSLSPEQLQKEVVKLTKQIQNVLSADVIPHQPWILIVLLQQSEENDQIILKNGSYGHMYQAIVTAALSRSKLGSLELTGKFTYLGKFAYEIFCSSGDVMSLRNAKKFHDGYCEQKDVPLEFEATLKDFVEAGILRSSDEGIRIVSRYATCFFIAWHLNRNLHESWAKTAVRELCLKLYDPISANTLLFLAHLNSSPFITDTIQKAAAEIFANVTMTDLDSDVDELNKLGGTSGRLTLPNSEPEKNRKAFIEEKEKGSGIAVSEAANDLQMAAIIDPVEKEGTFVEQMHEIQSAYKMIRILGQVLKNEADAADSDWKVAIVDEVFRLSRRMLGSGFSELYEVDRWRKVAEIRIKDQLIKQHAHSEKTTGRKRDPRYLKAKLADEKLTIRAEREIISICWLACFTVVKVVAEATGARALTGTFEKVVSSDSSIPNQLYQLDVLMEHGREFPMDEAIRLKTELKDNRFGTVLFQSLIAHHFYLYQTRFDVMQRICSKMDIKLDGRKALRPGRKSRKPELPKLGRK
ncbi:metallophosphoesterase family protein [Planctomycetes bacterium TBK1r]|uniref:Calcineurin-like phosphoesterase domain-containing protein n=1 Tax=Stieleria magnilauensis TaxID=2527963 RepID=A0ABX5XHP4_9BACT|nr:hypothetical protein TBK1r_03090 [Planctomycetes bacterium TBK1r]